MSSGRFDVGQIFDALVGWDAVEELLLRESWSEPPRSPRARLRHQIEHEHLLVRAMRHPQAFFRCRAMIAGHHLMPVVRMALRDRCWYVRYLGAQSRIAPPHLLVELALDPDRRMVAGVINNPSATSEVLDSVASRPDDDPKTAAWLAKRVTERRALRVSST